MINDKRKREEEKRRQDQQRRAGDITSPFDPLNPVLIYWDSGSSSSSSGSCDSGSSGSCDSGGSCGCD